MSSEKYFDTDDDYGFEGTNLPKSSRIESRSKNDSKQGWSDQHLGAVDTGKGVEQGNIHVLPYETGIPTPPRRRSIAPEQRKYNIEELGNNFEETPWVPPSVKLAKEYRTENMFRGGKAKLRNVIVTKAQDCGTGLPLYFQFIKTMAIAFFFMSLLSIPSLVMYHSGSRVSLIDRDLFGLYKYTLGNLGYSSDASLATTQCTTSGYGITANSTCISVFEVEITLVEAASIITAFEFLQVCVFFVAVMYLSYKDKQMTEFQEGRDCQVSDYSIIVRDIPPDTTMQQILTHFSNLYQLKEKDWRNRPPLAGAHVLEHSDNTQLDFHRGTWVAESVIFRKIGNFLRVFRNEQDLMEDLLRSRAFMKMYKDDTLHAYGPNQKKYEKAEKKLLQIGTQIDLLTESVIQKNKSKNFSGSSGKAKVIPTSSAPNRRVSLSDTIDAEACAAFIVFNYTESKARCIEDYTRYSRFPWSLFYPPKLKFRGQRIKVSRAPEPDEIIWENLEVPYSKKFLYRMRTLLVGFVLLVVGFAIILQSAVYQRKFKNSLPDLTLCKLNIPSLYYGSYSIPYSTSIERASTATDSYGFDRTAYDAKCEAVIPDSFYAVFTDGGDTTKPIATFDVAACTKAKAEAHSPPFPYYGECPQYNQTTFCPCVDVTGTDVCKTLACSTLDKNEVCETFKSSNIAGCYCYNELKSSLASLLTASGAKYMINVIIEAMQGKFTQSSDPCKSTYYLYASSKGLTYAASLTTVVINVLLKKYIFIATKREFHTSFESEEGNIIIKVFFVTFFNMAIIILLANGYLLGAPTILSTFAILQGSYIDMTVSWYGVIGNYLIITFVLNSITPYLKVMPHYCFIMPYRRWRTLPSVEKRKSHKIAMQADLNKLLIGPAFHSTAHFAQLLAMTFFAMMYGPGIPLFMPLMSVVLSAYFYLDKLLLLRYHQRPPHMSDGACKMVLSILPYAGLLRLAMGCWMYGNSDLTSSGIIDTGIIPGYSSADPAEAASLYTSYLEAHEDDKSISFSVISKVVRANVFPLFFLFIFVIVIKIIRAIWSRVPLYWVMEVLSRLAKFICRLKDVPSILKLVGEDGYVHGYDLLRMRDPMRLEMAPYTGNYFRYMKHVEEKAKGFARYFKCLDKSDKLLPGEKEQGWVVVQRDNYYMKVKTNLQDDVVDGVVRVTGTEKRTYEYIGDHGCYSYSLDRIPAYQMAVRGLREGTSNIAAYHMEADGRGQDLIVNQYLKKKRDKGAESDKKIIAELKASKSKGSGSSVNAAFAPSPTFKNNKIVPFAGAPDEDEMANIIRKEDLRRKNKAQQNREVRSAGKGNEKAGRGGDKNARDSSSEEDSKNDSNNSDDNDEEEEESSEEEVVEVSKPTVRQPRTKPLDSNRKFHKGNEGRNIQTHVAVKSHDSHSKNNNDRNKSKMQKEESLDRVQYEEDEDDWKGGAVTPTGFDDDGVGVPGLV